VLLFLLIILPEFTALHVAERNAKSFQKRACSAAGSQKLGCSSNTSMAISPSETELYGTKKVRDMA
jgi:hypothetical protein